MVTEPIKLTPAEARVLGALIEKEITTPDYYPLTLNALINACNQRSNREPVMDLDEDDTRQALHGLENKQLAGRARSADGRVTKYEHWLGEAFNFNRAETALICVLLLRGPQTPGELRSRTERIHQFDRDQRCHRRLAKADGTRTFARRAPAAPARLARGTICTSVIRPGGVDTDAGEFTACSRSRRYNAGAGRPNCPVRVDGCRAAARSRRSPQEN